MRKERLELSRLAPYASETYAYTNSATSATNVLNKFFLFRFFEKFVAVVTPIDHKKSDGRKTYLSILRNIGGVNWL